MVPGRPAATVTFLVKALVHKNEVLIVPYSERMSASKQPELCEDENGQTVFEPLFCTSSACCNSTGWACESDCALSLQVYSTTVTVAFLPSLDTYQSACIQPICAAGA